MVDEKCKTFLVSYRHDGAEWSLRLPARDYADARARLARLQYATVDGELKMTLPASTGPLTAMIVAVRNAFHSLRASSH
jgi:hypothetical protein